MQHPGHFDVVVQQALVLHQRGQIGDAESLYRQVLAAEPDHPDALHLLGLAKFQGGSPSQAVELIRRAATLRPRNWAFQGNLANVLFQLGNYAEAMAAYRQAAMLKPDEPQFQMGIANCDARGGNHPEAEARLRALVQRLPRYALGWFNLGNAVRDQARPKEAADLYRHALHLDPGIVDAYVNLGNALRALNRPEDAKRAFSDALEVRPGYVMARFNLASVLMDLGRFAEAEDICRKMASDEPGFAQARLYLGAALRHQGRLLEALPNYRKALELDPSDAIANEACALILGELGSYREAFRCFFRALHQNGDSAATHRNLGAFLLAAGRLADGWRSYLLRPDAELLRKSPDLKLSQHLPPALAGKHVCVLREQGLGDEIFFLRYARELYLRGARISYRASEKLGGLLRGVDFIHELLAEHGPLPEADASIMLGDLPHALTALPSDRLPLESLEPANSALPQFAQRVAIFFPPPPPTICLLPDAARVRELGARLRTFGSPPYIGMTWRGGTPPAEQTGRAWSLFKEIPLEKLAPALGPVSGTMISIQRNPKEGENSALSGLVGKTIHDLSKLNADLEGMLALLSLLDDYVGVSNTNMHLRAAVGKTARVLVPRPAEWRWMASGDESPWFPGFKIYRQKPDGSWDAAIDKLRSDLLASIGGLESRPM
jgi:tetratricopeptide (TPR) repeat protein